MVDRIYGMGGVPPGKGKAGRKRYAMVVDLRRCNGCNACTAACKANYDVPLGEWRMWVMETEMGEFPNTKRYVLPRLCNQCDDPPCVVSCPTQATFRHPDGFVLQRYNRCIGCRACMVACPYNARHLLPDYRRDKRNPRNVADKCDFCVVRVTRGLAPFCVASCTGGALIFGDINDPESEVARLVRENKIFTLRPELGTAPQVYYIGLNESIADPDFAFTNRSAQLRERYITFKHNSGVGGEMGGNIDASDMGFFGLVRQGLRNFASFFGEAPKKFFRGLY
ncbi:tetrathionate reductase subunit B precursor [bacterium BMS3Abin11]|nr:tetrathionate reductase subunit B precursor [bacterium BMS3Abin11]